MTLFIKLYHQYIIFHLIIKLDLKPQELQLQVPIQLFYCIHLDKEVLLFFDFDKYSQYSKIKLN